jgi:hypothetical protein
MLYFRLAARRPSTHSVARLLEICCHLWNSSNALREAQAHGVCATSIVFSDRADDRRAYLARMSAVDCALDTAGYSAGSVAVELSVAGVPVIAMAADHSVAARQATAILVNGPISALLLATSLKDYSYLAESLAASPQLALALRDALSRTNARPQVGPEIVPRLGSLSRVREIERAAAAAVEVRAAFENPRLHISVEVSGTQPRT